MHPTIRLPPGVIIPSYVVALMAAVVACHMIGPRWAHRLEGIEPRMTRCTLLLAGLGAFVGGRLHFVAIHWDMFANKPWDALRFWSGLHAGGAIVGAVVALAIVLPRSDVPAWRLADAIVPVAGVGIAIARLGCFLQGCCFGIPCALPWCVTFPPDSYVYQLHASLGLLAPGASRSAPVHPLQLYFAGAGLLMTATALVVRRRKRFDGEPTLVALLVYSASAAALEFLRGERTPRVFWGPLPQLEWVALAMTVATGAALVLTTRAHQRRPAAE
jgi:phosphatidylglycerol---prolipoprotein diacylglyceryl transferase